MNTGRHPAVAVRRHLAMMVLMLICSALTAQVRDTAAARTLVELVTLDSTIRLDIRYATANNFMGRPMYIAGAGFPAASGGGGARAGAPRVAGAGTWRYRV